MATENSEYRLVREECSQAVTIWFNFGTFYTAMPARPPGKVGTLKVQPAAVMKQLMAAGEIAGPTLDDRMLWRELRWVGSASTGG